MSAFGNFFSSLLGRKIYISTVFDQNFMFETQHVSFKLKQIFMTFYVT